MKTAAKLAILGLTVSAFGIVALLITEVILDGRGRAGEYASGVFVVGYGTLLLGGLVEYVASLRWLSFRWFEYFVFVFAALSGYSIWHLSLSVTGTKEPWDTLNLYYPGTMLLSGFVCGFLLPKGKYLAAITITMGQFPAMNFGLGMFGPITAASLIICGIPSIIGSLLGAWIRNGWRKMKKPIAISALMVWLLFPSDVHGEDKAKEVKKKESNVVKMDPLVKELLKDLKDATVYIYVDVYKGELDPEKALMASGLHEGYFLKENAKDLLRKNLQRYPIIKIDFEDDFEYPDFCDYGGSFSIKPKNADYSYFLELESADFITISKMDKTYKTVVSVSGVWTDCELTVYRICVMMSKALWPEWDKGE